MTHRTAYISIDDSLRVATSELSALGETLELTKEWDQHIDPYSLAAFAQAKARVDDLLKLRLETDGCMLHECMAVSEPAATESAVTRATEPAVTRAQPTGLWRSFSEEWNAAESVQPVAARPSTEHLQPTGRGVDRDWSGFDHARQHGGLALPIAADVPQHQLLALDAGAREKQLLDVAAAGDLTKVAQLLRARVSPDCRDQFGSSPLIQAVYFR